MTTGNSGMLGTTSTVTSSIPMKTLSSSAAYGATTISERQNRHGMVSIINTSIIIPVPHKLYTECTSPLTYWLAVLSHYLLEVVVEI
jgi:hypothetical protein